MFLIEDGQVHEIAIRTSKHIFEKTYLHRPDHEFLDAMVAAGSLRKVVHPGNRPDYGSCRKNSKQYPKLTSQVIWIDHSAAFEQVRTAFPDMMEAVSSAPGWKAMISDMGLERDVAVTISRDGVHAARLILDTISGEGFLTLSCPELENTAVLASIADSLPQGVLADRSEKRLRLGTGFVDALPAIQIHLAMAAEEAAASNIPARP